MEELENGRNLLLVSCATSIPESFSQRLCSTIFSGPDSYMTTDAKCIAVVLSLILILKEQYKENNKMKLKDVMQRAKCGVLGALVATGLTAFAEPEAVRLWEGGPYWATSNLGVSEFTTRPDYGALYKFDDADAAVKEVLGPEWRLPTEAEFSKLIDGTVCAYTWNDAPKNSLTVRGIGAYSASSITLPAGGYNSGKGLSYPGHWGMYWSSSSIGYYVQSLCIDTENHDKGIAMYERDWGLTIRPVLDAPPMVTVDSVSLDERWRKITVNYTLNGTVAARDYAVVFEVTADGRTASVTNNPAKLTDGMATSVVDAEKLFGGQVFDENAKAENAKVKVSLMKVVGARRLWEGGPYWAECNVGGERTGDCGDRCRYEDINASVRAPWRVPRKDEFDALVNNCYREWGATFNSKNEVVNGCRFMGVGEFSSRSIFLPAAGRNDFWLNQEGYYWALESWNYLALRA